LLVSELYIYQNARCYNKNCNNVIVMRGIGNVKKENFAIFPENRLSSLSVSNKNLRMLGTGKLLV